MCRGPAYTYTLSMHKYLAVLFHLEDMQTYVIDKLTAWLGSL